KPARTCRATAVDAIERVVALLKVPDPLSRWRHKRGLADIAIGPPNVSSVLGDGYRLDRDNGRPRLCVIEVVVPVTPCSDVIGIPSNEGCGEIGVGVGPVGAATVTGCARANVTIRTPRCRRQDES